MNFLKTLFWIALTVVVVVFATHNWLPVTLNLWGGLQADVKLPVLLLAAFLLGFVPTYAWYRARLWQARRRPEAVVRPAPVPPVEAEPLAPARPVPTIDATADPLA